LKTWCQASVVVGDDSLDLVCNAIRDSFAENLSTLS
jgi:hypothetical protein